MSFYCYHLVHTCFPVSYTHLDVYKRQREGSTITESQVRIAAKLVANGKADAVHTMFEDTLSVNMRGKNIPADEEVKMRCNRTNEINILFCYYILVFSFCL